MPQDGLNPIVQKMIDAGESEDNIATVIQHYKQQAPTPTVAPPVDRGGLLHPLTSMIAPELESARSALTAATDAPHGQPIMARSRTGTLYPSETGTGAVNAAKGAARGAGGALIDQAEGVTSPMGLAAAGLSQMTGTLQKIGTGAYEAFRPSQILGDIEKARTISPGRVGARMLGRAAKTIRTAGDVAPEADAATTANAAAPVAADAAPSALSDAERASLAKRYPGLDPSKVEQQMTGRLQMAPTDRPPITVSPESPMQAPRVNVGAEVVGRQNGLTKEAVRQKTAPILGEQPGEASPILPQQALGKIIDAVKALPPGGPEREAYVARATSGKAQWQIENVRRTLEHLGLIVPLAAAPAMLSGRLRQMPSQE